MKCIEEFAKWKKANGVELTLGTRVKVKESCSQYEPEYDCGISHAIVSLTLNSDFSINIGLNDCAESTFCEVDDYGIEDLELSK